MMADPKDRSAFFKNQGKDVNVSGISIEAYKWFPQLNHVQFVLFDLILEH